jgi:hypothetical protein
MSKFNDPVNEILDLLGLGAKPPGDRSLSSSSTATEYQTEVLLAQADIYSLWRVKPNNAEWFEVRGVHPVLRVTSTKARLLCSMQTAVGSWARRKKPPNTEPNCQICVVHRADGALLEIRHGDWRPIRLTPDQAKALVLLLPHLRHITEGG